MFIIHFGYKFKIDAIPIFWILLLKVIEKLTAPIKWERAEWRSAGYRRWHCPTIVNRATQNVSNKVYLDYRGLSSSQRNRFCIYIWMMMMMSMVIKACSKRQCRLSRSLCNTTFPRKAPKQRAKEMDCWRKMRSFRAKINVSFSGKELTTFSRMSNGQKIKRYLVRCSNWVFALNQAISVPNNEENKSNLCRNSAVH